MKTLNQLLTEVANNPYKYTKMADQKAYAMYKFKTDNDEILVAFARIRNMYDPKNKTEPALYNMSFNSMDAKSDEFDDPTNKGDAFRAFATIAKIAQEFYKKPSVGGVIISSKDGASKSRKLIYSRLIKKFGSGQKIDKVSKHKVLMVSDPELKNGTIVYKSGLSLSNPVDDFIKSSGAIMKDNK